MGDCTSRPSTQDLAAHNIYYYNVNDKHFIEKRTFIVPNIDSEEMQLLIQKLTNMSQIYKLRELFEHEQKKIASCQITCMAKLKQLQNKKFELNYENKNRAQVEIIKGRGIPNTGGCRGSKPFVQVTIQPLDKTFMTRKEETFIPK